ncbi:MAG: hypothetical protein KFF73_03180 [Cyclobacteriaceae bacterium]|nr:hypothetical protein [Cyclobacteriaceae bacterium]
MDIFKPILLLLACCHSFLVFGERNQIENPDQGDEAGYYNSGYEELVYVHTDRNIYLTGEYVKFKVYCLERISSRPSNLSKVAYVEIYNTKRSSLLQARIELKNGTGYGEIYIPTSANSANYVIRGYTRWMQNKGPESYFHAYLTILNPFRRPWSMELKKNKDTLKLYVEGGEIIENVHSRIVFYKEIAKNSESGFSGKLFTDDSVLVCEFRPLKNGLGSFEFTPEPDHRYFIRLYHEDGRETERSLPETKKTGQSLRILEDDNMFQVGYYCNDPSRLSIPDQVKCQVLQRGKILTIENMFMRNNQAKLDIHKNILKDGVFAIILTDAKGQILAVRKGFKYAESHTFNKLNLSKDTFKSREAVSFGLPDLLNDSKEDLYDLSVAVSTFNNYGNHDHISIDQYILLDNSCNLIKDLATYFNGPTAEVSETINNLLIASHNDVIFSKVANERDSFPFLPEYRAPLVQGKIYDEKNDQPVEGVLGYLSAIGKSNLFYVARSKHNGTAYFELRNFYGKHEMIAQCRNENGSIYSLEILNPYSQEFLAIEIPELELNESMASWLIQQSQNMQLTYAYRNYFHAWTTEDPTDPASFYGKPDATYFLDDYTRFPVMEEVMREYINGIFVRKNRDGFHFIVNDLAFNINYEEGPLILLDGIPVFDADDIMALDPLSIQKIETIRGKFSKGYLNCHGIVSYSSYKGDLGGYKPPDFVTKLEMDGLQIRKSYIYPDYENLSDRKNRMPDFRNNLYWIPDMVWHSKQKEAIKFYTSDALTEYAIIINGISKNGIPYSGKATFMVE